MTTAQLNYLPDKQKQTGSAPPSAQFATKKHYADYAESNVEYKLTPDRLAQIFRSADAGQPNAMIQAMEGILLRDGHLRGLYETSMDAIYSEDFEIRPGASDKRSRDACTMYIEATQNLDHSILIEHSLNSVFFGYSFTEIAWSTVKVNGKDLQVPVEFANIPTTRFLFDTEGNPLITSEQFPSGEPLVKTNASSWMQSYSRRWRKRTKAGLLRVAAYLSVFKSMSLRDWLVLLEKLGVPLIIAKYGDDQSATTRAALETAIKKLGNEGWAIFENDATIQVLTEMISAGAQATGLHGAILGVMNAEMSKLISGGTLNSETQGQSSFASAKVHADRDNLRTLGRAKLLARITQRDIGRQFMVRNGLPGAPLYLHSMVARDALLVDAQLVETMSRIGLPLSAQQMRTRFNCLEPIDAADTIEAPQPSAPMAKGNQP
jgi:phage gp29-like protein